MLPKYVRREIVCNFKTSFAIKTISKARVFTKTYNGIARFSLLNKHQEKHVWVSVQSLCKC